MPSSIYYNKINAPSALVKWLSFTVCFLVPFLGGNHLALPGVTIDRFFLETTFVLLLVAAVILSSLQHKALPGTGFVRFLRFFMPFFVVCALSLLYTWSPYNTARELNVLVWTAGAVYVYSRLADKEAPLAGLVWGCAALVLCAILQYKILFPQLLAAFEETQYHWMLLERKVPFGAFVNENMLGGYLVLVLPVSLYFAFIRNKRAYLASTVVIIAGILFSLSRLSAVVMFLELVTAGGIILRQSGRRPFLVCAASCLAGFVLFFCIIYTPAAGGEKPMRGAFQEKASSAVQRVKTLHFRTEIWKGGMRAFAEKPAIGYGAGSFEFPYRRHFDGLLYTRYSHGSPIKIGVETGLIGLLAYAWYLVGTAIGAVRSGRRYLVLVLSVIGGFLFSLVDCALDTSAFVVTFFLLSSFFIIKEGQDDAPTRARSWGLFAAIALLVVVSFAFTARAGLARKSLDMGLLAEETGFLEQALRDYQDSTQIMPLDNEPLIAEIRLLTTLLENTRDTDAQSRITPALDGCLARAAKRRDKDAELFFVCARAYWAKGMPRKALADIRKAINLYPSTPYYVVQAVRWYMDWGDLAQASVLIDRFEPYVANIKRAGNPYGLYVYKVRELQADIAAENGDFQSAAAIARRNLASAESDEFIITNHKARDYVQKEWLVRHLTDKVNAYEIRARNLH
jgi:O-antigen ligase/tetratricopeptide (TPR) repeat protein